LPGAPVIGKASSGKGVATANWKPPKTTGGAAIKGYVVTAWLLDAAGNVLGSTSYPVAASARSLKMTLVPGRYAFSVQAKNVSGVGVASARSNVVVVR
jgi:hypothetical protein